MQAVTESMGRSAAHAAGRLRQAATTRRNEGLDLLYLLDYVAELERENRSLRDRIELLAQCKVAP